ncbi:MAG: PQQ-binding-like beta-propeller repeat protein [Prolixibacteraceae bacterium]|nr:PQQ-binding-like beta-propeller repeat protein [Prolixibacteraceae bacterium]
MDNNKLYKLSLLIITVAGLSFIFWWLGNNPSSGLSIRVEGEDNRGAGGILQDVNIGEIFNNYSSDYDSLSESWPRFRGSDFDNISKSPVRLIDKFSSEDPRIIWSVELGEGHSGAAIFEGLVYLLDYDEEQRADLLRCFSLTDGRELWSRGYNLNIKRNHGMSRTIPAVTDDYILTIGPMCHVMCLDRETGDLRWGLDVAREYESEVPLWYTGQCPLIDDGKAIIATGGKALMVAIDCETGEKLWETPNPSDWKMSHSSVMPFTYGGRKMYVYSAAGALVGIAADGDDAGKLLWSTTEWNHSVIAPSPVCMPDGRIFMTAGYGAGSMMARLSENNGEYSIEVITKYPPRDGLACEQQTPLYWNGHLFGIVPKDGGPARNQLVCVHPDDPQKPVWTSGPENRFGMGPFFIADNKLFILDDDGTLTIAKPDLQRYIQYDQVKVVEDGHDAWAPFAIANGYLMMRDASTMVCLDLNR